MTSYSLIEFFFEGITEELSNVSLRRALEFVQYC